MTKPFKTLDDMGDIAGKAVLVREDLNVPMKDGAVSDDNRLRAAMPTILELADRGAKVLILAHFGRPKGQKNPEYSLSKITRPLTQVLGRDVQFIPDCQGEAATDGIAVMRNGDIAILENTRFHPGEEKNDPALVDAIAAIGDLYVNDAFSAAHRAHASTEGVAHKLPSFAGRSMEKELDALQAALGEPVKPVAAVVGGAKVSTKLDVLNNLVTQVDHLIIGGGMANTFLYARGVDIGKSLCEHDLTDIALEILDAADKAQCTVHLPYDVVVAKEFKANPPIRTV
ncbi:MAG TPA: phosphoglycerate kinase, partial [Vicinamibacterales bacterium]